MAQKKHRAFRIWVIVICAAVCISLILFYGYRSLSSPVKTQTALAVDVYRTADTMIYAVRQEEYITAGTGGYVVPMVDSGERVAKGDAVAAVFADETCAQAYTSYRDTADEIAYYNKLSLTTASQYSDLDKLTADADAAVYQYAASVYQGDLQAAHENALEVRSRITSRQNASGEQIDYSGIISSLNSKSASYLASAGQYSTLYSQNAGYYISDCDGYENLVSYSDAASMTVDEIDRLSELVPREVPENAVGKLICYFDWYFVCNIDVSDMSEIKVGQVKQILLPYSPVSSLRAEVYKINDTQNGKTAVVFRVGETSADLASLRWEQASIVLDSYHGYRIPNKAIRMVDGEKGVYILRDSHINFKKIDIFYTSDDYSVVGNTEGAPGYIRLYDEVIVEGTDLYDGKSIA